MTSAVRLCVASDGSDWADLILRASCTTCVMELHVSPGAGEAKPAFFSGASLVTREQGPEMGPFLLARDGQEDERLCGNSIV